MAIIAVWGGMICYEKNPLCCSPCRLYTDGVKPLNDDLTQPAAPCAGTAAEGPQPDEARVQRMVDYARRREARIPEPPRRADGGELPPPKGICVEKAAAMLQLSVATVRRMIAAGRLVAWKPCGSAGRKWLVDEVSLAAAQAKMIREARRRCAQAQADMTQGWFPF